MDARIQRILGRVKPKTLNDFKNWIHMPRAIATLPQFSAENALVWVPRHAFAEYIRHMIGKSAQEVSESQTDENLSDSEANTHTSLTPAHPASNVAEPPKVTETPSIAQQYIEISSDESEASPVKAVQTRNNCQIQAGGLADTTRKAITYIEISSDESDASPSVLGTSLKRNYPPSAIRINRSKKNLNRRKREYIEITSDSSEGDVDVVEEGIKKARKTI
ncbi:hypothetical protein H0H93_012105 [Arthromyces matolae]|nr:hypothetical protein H0H93_012105 [Arthromyces matolae]